MTAGYIGGVTGLVMGFNGTGGPAMVVEFRHDRRRGRRLCPRHGCHRDGREFPIVQTGSNNDAVDMGAGTLVNGQSGSTAGLITAGRYAVSLGGTGGTVTNFGTIESTGTAGDGVTLATGTLSNTGTITSAGIGSRNAGVYVGQVGSISNGPSGATGALISGYNGIFFANNTGTVTNYGRIAAVGYDGIGVALDAGGYLTNFGTIVVTGTGRSGVGAYLDDGSVTNGSSGATSALISGYGGIVFFSGPATIVNYGTVLSTGLYSDGVRLDNGGSISNRAGALISGYYGVEIYGGGTVTNYGTMSGTGGDDGAGIYLGGGTLTNFGSITAAGIFGKAVYLGSSGGSVINGAGAATGALISGNYIGVFSSNGSSTVTNYGTIQGISTGVRLNGSAGNVTNFGTISGTSTSFGTGVYFAIAGSTLTNAGTITGSRAAQPSPSAAAATG